MGRFLAWCEAQGLELCQVTPGLAGRFIEDLPGSDPTRNLALAALRHFFDALVTRPAVALNPFASVRGRKYAVVDGKTPELTIQQARALLRSLDRSNVVGLRDRAVLGVLTYTGARVGALARRRRGDLQNQETQRVLRFRGGGSGKAVKRPGKLTFTVLAAIAEFERELIRERVRAGMAAAKARGKRKSGVGRSR